jgi:hypothetical protein
LPGLRGLFPGFEELFGENFESAVRLFHLARGPVAFTPARFLPLGPSWGLLITVMTFIIVPVLAFALLALVALTLALLALTVSVSAVGLLVGLARRIIALVLIYRWSYIIKHSGKWVLIWRRKIGLSESWTGFKTVVSSPTPTHQNEG